LIVVAADNNTKQIVRLSLGDDQQRLLVMSLIDMLLVSSSFLFLSEVTYQLYHSLQLTLQ